MPLEPDSYAEYDAILNDAARTSESPWRIAGSQRTYSPDYELLERLLEIPITSGVTPETGRFVNALDVWIADELRRARFEEHAVWPRRRQPRVADAAIAALEDRLLSIERDIEDKEQRRPPAEVMMPSLRNRIFAIRKNLPGRTLAHVLGRFYLKQVDVLIADIERGPELIVSSKTMGSDFAKNIPNRFEEAIGDGTNLKARFPLAPTGFAMLVRSTVFNESGSYAAIDNIIRSLETAEGRYDAAMVLIAEWDDPPSIPPSSGWTPNVHVLRGSDPRVAPGDLLADRFMKNLIERLFEVTPVQFHIEPRRLWGYVPPGGYPPPTTGAVP